MQTGREKLKAKEGERAIGCCDLSALTGMSRANMHLPCPLGQFPWKRYFSPLHILLYIHPTCTVFPAVSMWFKWTVCKSRELIMSFMWTCMQHRGIIWLPVVQASDPQEAKLQLIVFPGSEVRATIFPAVMKQYNLAVIWSLSHRPITNKSAEAKITTVLGHLE